MVTRSAATARRAVRAMGGGTSRASIASDICFSRVILITAPDDAVATVAEQLAKVCGSDLRRKVVLHTGGALDASVLAPVKALGAATGSMHPLQSFSGVGVPPLEGKVFAIEGDAAAVRVARAMVRSLGGLPVQIRSASKPVYHAAATMAAAGELAVFEAAIRMLMRIGMKRREAVRALMPLTRQVLDNLERLGPRLAWTGPLSRGDYNVIASHVAALREFPRPYGDVYDALNRLTAAVLAASENAMHAELDKISEGKRLLTKATGK